jgi:uncharacterized protein YyaL (SSP411 family)
MTRNRLGQETSPYLLQHKDNPVHWWPWGPEALAEAKRTGKPILLSVGYAACHWCHVMAHESFEDQATADLMNQLYVNIKVDREERPDVDAIYMGALHRLGEQGGWPLTMFLDSDGRPFWGGTYFPPEPRWGKPSFKHVLHEVERIYREEPDKVQHNAALIVEALQSQPRTAPVAIGDAALAELVHRLVGIVDPVNGGLEGAPKFPQWNIFWLLWRGAIRYGHEGAREVVGNTLTHICQGGIYDHLGGGFARYSVDDRWLVPHFEKMLYDNALLIDLMSEVYRETRSPLLEKRIAETVGWVEREMVAEGGGFASSLDADSEGEEGKFYVWTAAEIEEVLGPEDARWFGEIYDVVPGGNWEGHSILNRLRSLDLRSDEEEEARLAALRKKLFERREKRIRPGWDDKVLADWNGLMIAALAAASRVFDRPSWLALAQRAFSFVDTKMTRDGRLMHAARAGQLRSPATASDYANMVWAALRLYQVTNRADYLAAAERWTGLLDRHYWIGPQGGYAFTADDASDVIVRLKTAHDDATPNANALMVSNLVQLYLLTGQTCYIDRAEAIPRAFAGDLQRNLVAHSGLLAGMMDLLSPQHVVVMSGSDGPRAGGEMRDTLLACSLPGALQQILADGEAIASSPALSGKTPRDGRTTAYVCIGTQCSPPITSPGEFREALQQMRRSSAPDPEAAPRTPANPETSRNE